MTNLEDAPIAITAAILRNKGVPVEVFRTHLVTDTNEDGEIVSQWLPKKIENTEEDEKHERHVRFNANAFAAIEETFGGLGDFEVLMRTKPYGTVRTTLAIVWGWTEERAGAAMLADEVQTYAAALGVALALANGVDPTKAAEMLKIGFEAVAEAKTSMQEQVDEMLSEQNEKDDVAPEQSTPETTDELIGDIGSPSGLEPAELTPSSGV